VQTRRSVTGSVERDEEVAHLREENALLREASFAFGALAERLSLRLQALQTQTRRCSRPKRPAGDPAPVADPAGVTD
jgi:hypothetical protein